MLIFFALRKGQVLASIRSIVNSYLFLNSLTIPLLQEEFVEYQLLSDTDIPTEVWYAARVGEDKNVYYCMDITYLCKVTATLTLSLDEYM